MASKTQWKCYPLSWKELKGLMRFKYVPKGYTKLYNVDPRRQILRIKVDIFRALGFDLVLDDCFNLNYITPSTVAYLRLPRISRRYPYTMEGCKVTEVVKVSFTHCEYYEKGTHLFPPPKMQNERQKIERSKGEEGGNLRVEKGEVEWSTSNMNGGTLVPNKEPTIEGVMDALLGCPNIPKKVSFQDDEITLSRVPSSVNHESSVVLDSYALYTNSIWCEEFPPKDENLFLTNPFQEGENDAIQITSRPFTPSHVWELQMMEGLFKKMQVLQFELMTKRAFHSLNSNICARRHLSIEKYHIWMISWSMGGLTKQERDSEEAASFSEKENTSTTYLMP
ncbi:hypothetical protein KY284_000733 [Solanum tuberosum]|nr:hypothetical protein KY284_000733 [Solanum tuberosum]